MGKQHNSSRLSLPDQKSIDHKSRNHVEELHSFTDEILHRHHQMTYKYDYKLYRKYKKLKEINKKLQEKIVNQHCSGCKCHVQSNEETDDSVLYIDSKNSPGTENKENNSPTNSKKNSSDDDEGQMDINQNVSKTTNDDDIEEEVDDLSGLPSALQNIIQDKVEKSKADKKYLLKVGLYPGISKYLCNTTHATFEAKPSKMLMRAFILKEIKPSSTDYAKTSVRISIELRDIHQSYARKCHSKIEKKVYRTRGSRITRSINVEAEEI